MSGIKFKFTSLIVFIFHSEHHFFNIDNDTFPIQNHVLILFKLYIYNARKHVFLSKNDLIKL